MRHNKLTPVNEILILVLVFSVLNLVGRGLCSPKPEQRERTISNLALIESDAGVPVDYSYNETRKNHGSTTSAPGCPKSIDGIPWVQYGSSPEAQQCYLAGYRGPCATHETLLVDSTKSIQGFCACTCLSNEDSDKMEKSYDGRFLFCSNPPDFVFDTKYKSCYLLRKKGYCKEGEVLIRVQNTVTLKCVPGDRGLCGDDKTFNFQTSECEQNPPNGVYGGSSTDILPNRCDPDETYSSRLRKCLKKNRFKEFILG